MNNTQKPAPRPVRVCFVNCHDAKLFCQDVALSEAEQAQVGAALGWLQEAGVLLLPAPSAERAAGLDGLLANLRGAVGAPLVEAALSADPTVPPSPGGAPAATMPVWPFEVEGGDPADRDVLTSSARLWGADVLIEALRVDGPDHPVPVPAVRSRFDRWVKAAGGGRLRAAFKPPVEAGWYVLGAVSAAA